MRKIALVNQKAGISEGKNRWGFGVDWGLKKEGL